MSSEGFRVVGASNTLPSLREIDQIIVDNIAVMLKQESAQYSPCFDYLSVHRDLQPSSEHVNENWRRKICEWAFEVTDHFGFDREVVSIALNYLDRVVAHTTETTNARVPRKEFQLVAVTSLYLAIKLHGETDAVEGAPRKLRINAFVELSRGMFTIETLETTERAILSNLEWNVNPPTTVCFVASLLRLLPASWDSQPLHASVASSIFEMARYLTELSVCVSTFSFKFKSSEISYSAILCAIDALRDSVPLPYGARIAFLNSVAESTSLTPGADEIRKCCGMIMELCPSLFIEPDTPAAGGLSRSSSVSSAPGNQISASEEARISPVCVEQVFKEEFTQRKRIRSNSRA
mmetsp:Transcript_13486/g.24412  ORF Transcript_13486/g.24412 Transcript_13486/m.24412 type:complete len:350 (+) Transcript_13486:97-1146(+)